LFLLPGNCRDDPDNEDDHHQDRDDSHNHKGENGDAGPCDQPLQTGRAENCGEELGACAESDGCEKERDTEFAESQIGVDGHMPDLAANATHAPEDEREALHDQLADEHEKLAGGVDSAIEIGVVDEKIDPAHTRSKLTQALAEAPQRRGRHKNIPL